VESELPTAAFEKARRVARANAAARPSGTVFAHRVMRVVQALALLGKPAGPSEIAEVTGLDAIVVFRILQSGLTGGGERTLWDGMADDLCHPAGFFIRLPPGKYRLGPGAAQVGMEAMAQTPGPEVSRPVLEALARQQNGMALLWKLSPYGTPQRTVADFAPGRYGWDSLGLSIGQFVELTSTLRVGASGRAIASRLPPARISEILGQPVPVDAGPGAIRDSRQYQAAVEKARQNGLIGVRPVGASPAGGGTAYAGWWSRSAARRLWRTRPAAGAEGVTV
jgi:hypothetical protein